jgi:hypothetical protein
MAQHGVNPHTCTITVKEAKFTYEWTIPLREFDPVRTQSLIWCCFAQPGQRQKH